MEVVEVAVDVVEVPGGAENVAENAWRCLEVVEGCKK